MNDNDRSILAITALGHGAVHAYELTVPILLPIWMAEFGMDAAIAGSVVALGYGLYGVGAVPGGVATDAYGSRRLVVGCLLGMGASFLLLALVGGVVGLGLAVALWGVSASVYHPAGLRLISTGVAERGTGFAYHGIAGNLGIALGPLVAALLLVGLEWRLVAAIMALPALAAAGYAHVVRVDETAAVTDREDGDTTGHGDQTAAGRENGDGTNPQTAANGGAPSLSAFVGATRALFAGSFLVVFPIVILEGFYYRGVLTFLPDVLASYESLAPVALAGREVDPSRYVYVGLLVVGMAGQYVGGKATDGRAPERLLVGAFVALALLSVAFVPAASSGLAALLAVSALLGFVLFGEQPLLQAMVADYSESDVRGLSYGYMFLGVFGVGSLGAAVSGAALAYTSQRALFVLLAAVPTVAAAIAIGLTRRRSRSA